LIYIIFWSIFKKNWVFV